jgi:cysteine/O-acetylserine efflux protein
MPQIDWAPFFAFFLSTTLSPGPNNMASAANGLQHGFKKTLPFIFGIISGFFVYMLIIALVSSAILKFIPQFQLYLKIIGGGYILWLAYRSLRATYQIENNDQPPLSFINGFLLQFVNPKVIFFGLTIFTGFLHSLTASTGYLVIAAAALAAWVFLMNSFWAGAGSVIFSYFNNPTVKRIFSLVIAAMLVYAALNIFGFFEYIKTLGPAA